MKVILLTSLLPRTLASIVRDVFESEDKNPSDLPPPDGGSIAHFQPKIQGPACLQRREAASGVAGEAGQGNPLRGANPKTQPYWMLTSSDQSTISSAGMGQSPACSGNNAVALE